MSSDLIAIALAQLNPTLGDFSGNLLRARTARKSAAAGGADVILFNELFICGYPPEDLVLKPAFVNAAMATTEELAKDTADGGPAMLVGTPWRKDGAVHNAVALLDGGAVQAVTFKTDLPNYGFMAQSNIRSLLHLVHELDAAFPSAVRTLWTESGENFAQRLQEALEHSARQ